MYTYKYTVTGNLILCMMEQAIYYLSCLCTYMYSRFLGQQPRLREQCQ